MFNHIANTCAVMFTGATVGSVAIVAPAFASSRAHSPAHSIESMARVSGAYGSKGIGQGVQGTTVYNRGRYVGRDPDPSIRGLLLRDDFRDRSM
jgi:hypothetical protein